MRFSVSILLFLGACSSTPPKADPPPAMSCLVLDDEFHNALFLWQTCRDESVDAEPCKDYFRLLELINFLRRDCYYEGGEPTCSL